MKNIAIISMSLNSGGAERIAGLLSKELSRYYNVYLFLLSIENIMYEYGGTIVDIGQSGPFYEYPIKKYKEKYQIEVAISFLEIMNFANIRTRGKERVIISERCVQSLIEPPLISQTEKIKRYYNFADEIVSCSEGVKFDLVHNYKVNNTITTIYNFIDKKNIISKSQEALPNEILDFLNGSDFFINVGRLHPQKNQKRLILQFSYFHTTNPNVKLLILGSGELEEELISYIKQLKLDNYIKIVPYTKNPFMYIKKAKALILASHYEGLPNAVLEAMILGCPVIATDCLAGPRELLIDEIDYEKELDKLEIGERGILVCDEQTEDNGSSQYMAKAMELLCVSSDLAENIKQNELLYMKQYSNQKIVEQWIEVIENCELKEGIDFFTKEEDILKSAKHIAIYGAGFVGKSIFLRLNKKYKIDCFIVSKREEEKEFLKVPIREITEVSYFPKDTAIIMGVGDIYQDDVLNTLQNLGCTYAIYPFVEPLSYDYYKDNNHLDIKSELKDWYRLHTGKDINIDSPNTFNEKIQWLKLYDNQPIKGVLADKYAVREYVLDKIGDRYLIPLLGVWNVFDEIDFSSLPSQFVLKCTHGSGTNILVKDKSKIDYQEFKRKFEQWMNMDYSYMSGFETHYTDIVPKIIAEEMLQTDNGEDLRDYKVFVFNGKVKLIQVDIDRNHIHRRNVYTPKWEYVPVSILYPTAPEVIIEKPKCLRELIHLSEILGAGFIHVRVDFYIWKEKIYFGEMTFTHGSGTEKFEPEEYGLEMGLWMELPKGE